MNTLKTFLLLGALGVLAVMVGRLFGTGGMAVGLVFALLMNGGAYFFGDRMALAAAGARPLQPGEADWLASALDDLSRRAGIPTPRLFLSPDPQPNAFAAGRGPGHAVVCVNEGLLRLMPKDQVMAVLAHELGHVKNRDTLVMTVAASMAAVVSFMARMGLWFGGGDDRREGSGLAALVAFFVAPLAGLLVQLAVSRTREYGADRVSAELMGSAAPMIGALRSLERGTQEVPSRFAGAATAPMYVASPLSGRAVMGLFSTHPAIGDRVRRLAEYGR